MAKLTIDGKEIEVPDGTSLFDACRDARGEALPHFCYHPDLSIAGVCRLCQVEVEGMPKLTIACNTGVRDGMVVHTRNERVTKASKQILEMHLINHPVDCPICDQAGECGLQNQYMNHGLYDTKVEMDDKVHKNKAQVIGPHVILDQERCVLCSRCVRFCTEVTGTGEMGIFNRGDRARIGTAPGVELDNDYSMNTVDICPVGALTSRDFRFQKRVWMLKAADSVCPGCATGCNVRIDHEAGHIYRLKPRYNPEVNGRWMCDKGRMTYKAVHDENRVGDPSVGGRTGTWADVTGTLAKMVGEGGFGLVVGSPHHSLEELHLLKALAKDAPISGGLDGSDRGDGDDLLMDADRTPNRRGLELLGISQHDGPALADLIKGSSGPVLILGGNPAADPTVAAALGEKDSVIYIGSHGDETAGKAEVVLPGSMWAEKVGIFVNRKGRLQEFKQAVARHGNAREDWRILTELMTACNNPDIPGSLKAVRDDLAGSVAADVDLNKLPVRGFLPGGEAR
jgi:NADH-quinone oxidoreductase subunit G